MAHLFDEFHRKAGSPRNTENRGQILLRASTWLGLHRNERAWLGLRPWPGPQGIAPFDHSTVSRIVNRDLGIGHATMSLQALADMALRSLRLLPEIKQHIEELSVIGTPAMKARSKKLLKSLAK